MKKTLLTSAITAISKALTRRLLKLSPLLFVFYSLTGYAQCGYINTVAGNGTQGYSGDGGVATSAELYSPSGVAVDASGNIYIADGYNNRIRKVSASTGIISTVAGNGTVGFSGDGGAATTAELNYASYVALDASGNIYISDGGNSRIRKVTVSTGIITTIAGNGTFGYSGDGGPATSAELSQPYGIALDDSANIYIADINNQRIRKVSASTGIISTIAGNGTAGYSGDGGAATSAELYEPFGLAVDASGNIYIGDSQNYRIREVSASTGIISTVAGNGTFGYSGDGGIATSAEIGKPYEVAVDDSGNIYISDGYNYRVRKVTASTGIISTIAGNGTGGYSGDGGAAILAEVNTPDGVAVDASGNIYFADMSNNRIREITGTPNPVIIGTPTGCGSVTLTATGGTSYTWSGGSSPGTATNTFTTSGTYTVTATNNGCTATASVAVTVNTFSSSIIKTVAGNGSGYSGDGGPATAAGMQGPAGVAVDDSGNIYIADIDDYRIRKVTALTGIISTVAGNGINGYSGDGGAATSARLYYPQAVAVDASGNIYIAGQDQRIRKVTASTGIITTVGGNGTQGYSGDGGPATLAELNLPDGIAVDDSGNIYIGDSQNNRIRKVSASTGIITTVAGNGNPGYSGDGGAATSAELYYPSGMAVDGSGNIFIADQSNNRIRKVTASTGLISTIAGNGTAAYSGDGGPATSAELNDPSGVSVDVSGNIYISDEENSRIREVSASTGIITTVAGNGTAGYSGDGGLATSAELRIPKGVAVGISGNIYIADQENYRIREVTDTPALSITGTTTTCGSVTLTATGGTSYTWSGGSSPNTATNTFISSNTYIVTATGTGGCTATAQQAVTVNTIPTAGITGTATGCGTVSLTATGTGTYAWSGGSSPNTAANTFISSNTYTVTVTGTGGCSATVSQVVTVNPTVTAGITGTATGCGLVSLTATGGNSYTWSGGSSPNTATNTFTSSNTYIVTATGTGGCSATASQAVTVNPNITAGITGTATGCGSVSLTATGGGSYAWNGGNSTNTAANTFTSSNTYTVTVTGTGGCSATASQAVTVNIIPTATITPTGSTTFCQGDSVILTASAGSSYLWSTSATTQSIDVKNPGSYTVQVGNANCSATSAATVVTVNALPNAAINGPTTICSGLQATLTASGGTGYSWNNGLGTNAQVNVQPTNTTTYIVTVTNANNCSATAQQTVSVTSTPSASITGPIQVCSGNGITLTANGGNTYAWANGLGSNATINVSPTSNTTYTVTATIGANCSATASQTVAVYQPGASQYSYAMCSGQTYPFNNQNLAQSGAYYDTLQTIHGCDSIVTLNLTVNSILQTAFSDSICHGDSVIFKGQSLTTAGTYKDTLQSITGCDSIVTLSLSIKSTADTVNATAAHPAFCSGDSTQVCATAGFAAYNWNNNASTACFYTGSANTYSVTVTDVHGCTAASNSIVITTYTPSSVTITSSGDTVSSTGAAAYQWYFNSQPITGDTSNVIIAQHTGSYTVETTDSNGCHYNSSAVVVNTGIGDIAAGEKIIVFPNPASTVLYISSSQQQDYKLLLLDVTGQMVLQSYFTESAILNVADLARGIYLAEIFDRNNVLLGVKKVVLQ